MTTHTRKIFSALAALAVSVGLALGPATSADAKDTQWGGKTHHHVLKDTQWGGKHAVHKDTQWGG